MSEGPAPSAADLLRVSLARRGITLPDADIAAGAAQLTGVLRALERLDELDLEGLEPTTYPRFDP